MFAEDAEQYNAIKDIFKNILKHILALVCKVINKIAPSSPIATYCPLIEGIIGG